MTDLASSNVTDLRLECGEPADMEFVKVVEWWVFGVLTNITGVFGIIGNFISISILCKKSMKNLFHHLLLSLCLADMIFIITNVLMSPKALNSKFLSSVFTLAECGCHFSLAASVFLTMAITMERYQAVYEPYKGPVYTHWTLFFLYVVPSFLFAIVFNIPRFIVSYSSNLTLSFLKFLIVFQVVHPLSTTGLIPLIILGVMNFRIYMSIPASTLTSSRRRRAKHFRMARIAVALVFLFVIFNTPRLTIGIYEVTNIQIILQCFSSRIVYYPSTSQLVGDIFSQYFALLNSSVNFLAYCMLGSQFQAEFMTIVRKYLIFIKVPGGSENEATPENNSVDNKEVDDSQGDEVDEANDNFELQERTSRGTSSTRQFIQFVERLISGIKGIRQ